MMHKMLEQQVRVIHALMLRDMRTRFGRSHWGFVIAVVWPFLHILVLVVMLTLRGIPISLGTSVILFVVTGTMPYIAFMYISRKVMESISSNRPLTFFPQVKIIDIVLARTILEIATAFATLTCVLLFLACANIDPMPHDPWMALQAYLCTIWIGIGLGLINACIVTFFPAWQMGYILAIILFYGLSGIFMVPEAYPQQIVEILSLNPILQCVSWMRMAYYPEYKPQVDPLYIFLCGCCLVAIGLLLERLVVRRTSA